MAQTLSKQHMGIAFLRGRASTPNAHFAADKTGIGELITVTSVIVVSVRWRGARADKNVDRGPLSAGEINNEQIMGQVPCLAGARVNRNIAVEGTWQR